MDYSILSPYELGETRNKEAIAYLIKFLQNGDYNEKRLAASAINKLSDKYFKECNAAIPYLNNNLSHDKPQVRQYSLSALKKLDISDDTIKIIKSISENDPKEYNRNIASGILKNYISKYKEENKGEFTALIKEKVDVEFNYCTTHPDKTNLALENIADMKKEAEEIIKRYKVFQIDDIDINVYFSQGQEIDGFLKDEYSLLGDEIANLFIDMLQYFPVDGRNRKIVIQRYNFYGNHDNTLQAIGNI